MVKQIFFATIAFSFLTLFSGCGSCQKDKTEDTSILIEENFDWDVSEMDISGLLLPPADLMMFIYDMELKPDLINSPNSISKYINTRSKCINLGVYMADLAYLGLRDDKMKVPKYLKNVRQLSADLRIYNVFTEELVDRLSSNIHNSDSINELSRILQDNFVSSLDLSNRQNILAMVSLGIFVESLYLSVSNLDEYEDFVEINTEMLNQKLIFDQYYAYTEYFLSDPKVSSTMKEIEPLKNLFNDLLIKESAKSVEKDSLHHITIKGGASLVLAPEYFETFRQTISDVRKQLTLN